MTVKGVTKDKGWAWFVVLSAGLILFIQRGLVSGFTLTFQQFLQRFEFSRSSTSWIYTVHSMSGMLVAPIAGALGKRFSYRGVTMVGGCMYLVGACLVAFSDNVYQAYLTYGLISGVGMGMATASSMIMINLYFDKRKSIAMAIAYVMNSFGAIIVVPLMSYSYENNGYTGTMLLIGAGASHLCLAGAMFRPSQHFDKELTKEMTTKEKFYEYFDISLLNNKVFLFYCVMMMAFSYSASSQIVILAGFAEERGLSHAQIATVISVAGAIGIPVRICTGLMCDKSAVRRHRTNFFCFATVVTGLICLAMPLSYDNFTFTGVYITYAFVSSVIGVQEPVVLADITGEKRVAGGVGISRTFRALGIFFGPAIAGHIKDISGSYNLSYYVAGSFILYTALQLCVVRYLVSPGKQFQLPTLPEDVEQEITFITCKEHVEQDITAEEDIQTQVESMIINNDH